MNQPVLAWPQPALIQELRGVVADYDLKRPGDGRASSAQQQLFEVAGFVLRLTLERSSGRPLSRKFLDFLRTEFVKDGSNNAVPALSCRKIDQGGRLLTTLEKPKLLPKVLGWYGRERGGPLGAVEADVG